MWFGKYRMRAMMCCKYFMYRKPNELNINNIRQRSVKSAVQIQGFSMTEKSFVIKNGFNSCWLLWDFGHPVVFVLWSDFKSTTIALSRTSENGRTCKLSSSSICNAHHEHLENDNSSWKRKFRFGLPKTCETSGALHRCTRDYLPLREFYREGKISLVNNYYLFE